MSEVGGVRTAAESSRAQGAARRSAAVPVTSRLAAALAVVVPMAVFAAASGLYSHLTPLGQAPDEGSHAAYMGLIAHALQLPGPGVPERQQPPLYYLLGAGVLKLTRYNLYAVRDLSVGLGVLTVLFAVLSARLLWPRQPVWWAVTGLLVAMIPQFQFISGSVTDDALADFTAAFLTYLLIRVLRTPVTARLQLLVGLGLGLAVVSKETDYALAALLALVATARWWGRTQLAAALARVAVPALVVAGWWLGRNTVIFGRPFPHFHPAVVTAGITTKLQHLSQLPFWFTLSFHSFIGVFGNMSSPLQIDGHTHLVFHAIEVATAVAAAAILVAAARRWRRWDRWMRILAVALAAVLVLAVVQSLGNSILVDFQAQGRYFFVALPAMAIGLTFLLRQLARALPPALVAAGAVVLMGGFLTLDLGGLNTVAFHLLHTPVVPGHLVIT